MRDRDDSVINKINRALKHGKPLVLNIEETMELADFVNRQIEMSLQHAAMLNLYVEKTQGQISYQIN
jgi:hypothetical protein